MNQKHVLACLTAALIGTILYAQDPQPASYEGAREQLHVYLLIGQSNMAGRAPYGEAEAGPIDRCFLLNGEDRWEPATNPLNRYSTIRKGLGMQKMNPGYGFAKAMLEANKDISIGLVVNAKGGTRIGQWKKGTTFYKEAVRRAKEAEKTGVLKGILWHQGESDSGNPAPYLGALEQLIADLRSDLGNATLPFVVGEVHYDAKKKPRTKAINDELEKLPGRVRGTGCVSSEGLPTQDHTHFNNEGIKELGRRYAATMLEVQAKHSSTSR